MTEVVPFDDVVTRREIAETLVRLRERAGISRLAAARHLGKSKNTLLTWERGVHEPNVSDFIRALDLYGKLFKIVDKWTPRPPSKAWKGAAPQTKKLTRDH